MHCPPPMPQPPLHIRQESPDQPDVLALIAALDAYQAGLYPPEAVYALDLATLLQPHVVFLVARDDGGTALGCGAVVISTDGSDSGDSGDSSSHGGNSGEIKRMVVHPAHRGRGVARQILQHLQARAAWRGCRQLLLETGPLQPEALALYASQGFVRRGPFGSYPDHPLSVFMGKPLPPPPHLLQTARLGLRPYRAEDASWLGAVFADAQAARFYPHMGTPEAIARWIGWNLRNYAEHGFGLWVLERLADGRPVGDAGITWQTVEGERILEIGWHLHPDWRSQGLATEAGRACLQHGFSQLQAPLLGSIVDPANAPSIRVAGRVHAQCRPYEGRNGPMLLFYTRAG